MLKLLDIELLIANSGPWTIDFGLWTLDFCERGE